MSELGRWLIFLGIAISAIGLIVWTAARFGFRGLPGDVRVENTHVRVYFPIITCLVLSALLTIGMWLWRRMSGR